MNDAVLDPRALADLPELADSARELARPHDEPIGVGGLWGSAQALFLAALQARAQGPWIVVAASEAEAELFAADLEAFGVEATLLPARASGPSRLSGSSPDADSVRARLQVAQLLAGPPERRPRLLVASLLSMLQPVPTPDELSDEFLHLQVHNRLDPEDLLERLVGAGYTREPLAEAPGELSLRGDILDVFPFAAELPLRIELFDDEIESLRTFDPADQRSVETHDKVAVCIASDAGGVEDGRGAQPFALVSPTAVWVRVEPLRIADQAEGLRIRSSSHQRALVALGEAERTHPRLDLQSLPGASGTVDVRSVQNLSVGVRNAADALREELASGRRTIVLCRTEAEERRFRGVLEEAGDVGAVETRLGSVSKGFRMPAAGCTLVNHREIAGVVGARQRTKKHAHRVRALSSFFELRPGDLVVHAVHGVALFQGLKRMPRGGAEEDHLQLVFADEVGLFVPASRIDLVQRYVGSGSKAPPLDKLGSTSFKKRKAKVERALQDLAAELLEVQAKRELAKRDPWPEDDELVRDMVESFPFEPTPDQARADEEIARDLHGPRPLDRLLCGDVGFGKTEVAVRAAFRVVNGGGQVAILVPTTVLADQHERTFRERLADFPVEVGVLSRYATGKEARATVKRIAEGEIDIAIGTHRLLSKDVSFQRLGLVIIDEEQRFGVKHKEHFKSMRAGIDLLTLSATPIPRTLHMSLSGLRDISSLSDPPEGRQDVETVLAYCEDDDLVRDAIRREKTRGGQVFFLHNRVHSIEATAERLRNLVPECTFAIGHGQMGGRELSTVMDAFVAGDADVLVATTIIENGIDIPSAGTIVIDRADTFGLAELHQLRGRVGRGDHKAFCYLLVEESRPLTTVAKERLKALEEMSQLGAGFQISMKDLEIRGAGNLLGAEQSGHIAAIGYDMYCRLLRGTADRLQAQGAISEGAPPAQEEVEPSEVELELGVAAFVPEAWIRDPRERVELLRHLDEIRGDESAAEQAAALRDRYGRLPEPVEELIALFRLRARLAALGVTLLAWRTGTYLVEYRDRVALEAALEGAGAELRPLAAGRALLVLPDELDRPDRARDWLEELLQRRAGSPMLPSVGEAR